LVEKAECTSQEIGCEDILCSEL